MTYQEIQDRLSKCESTLEQLKNGSVKPTEKITVKNLEVLKESLEKQLSEADKGIVYTDDEVKAKDLADKGANVKLTSEMKPGDEEDLERRRFNQLSRKDQNTLIAIKAMMDKEKAKNEAPDGPPISKMTRADMIDFLNTTPEKVKHMSDEELRDAAIDKNDDVRETEYDTTVSEQPADYPADLSEAVDPSITDLLVQFVTLMGMGYGVYQAAKKLSDKHGDINLDSIKAALSKKEDKEKDDYGRNHYPEKGEYIKLGDEEREAMKNNKLGIKENEIGDADDNVGMGYKNARDIINYLREKIYPYMDNSELQEFNDEMHTHFASNSSRFVKEGDDICSCCNNPIVNGSCGCPDDCPHCGGKGKVEEDDNPVPQGRHINVNDMQFMHDSIVSRMKELAKIYKEKGKDATVMLGVNKFNMKQHNVVDVLKKLTVKKRELEDAMQNKVARIGHDQELDEAPENMYYIKTSLRDARKALAHLDKVHKGQFDVSDPNTFYFKDEAEANDALEHFGAADIQVVDHNIYESVNEAKATCCGKCGRVHVKGTKCKTPYLKGKDHCRNN